MNEINELLKKQQISQSELARRTGFSRQHISNMIRGKQAITAGFVGRVFVEFGTEAAQLLAAQVDKCLKVDIN